MDGGSDGYGYGYTFVSCKQTNQKIIISDCITNFIILLLVPSVQLHHLLFIDSHAGRYVSKCLFMKILISIYIVSHVQFQLFDCLFLPLSL